MLTAQCKWQCSVSAQSLTCNNIGAYLMYQQLYLQLLGSLCRLVGATVIAGDAGVGQNPNPMVPDGVAYAAIGNVLYQQLQAPG